MSYILAIMFFLGASKNEKKNIYLKKYAKLVPFVFRSTGGFKEYPQISLIISLSEINGCTMYHKNSLINCFEKLLSEFFLLICNLNSHWKHKLFVS